MGLKNIHLHKGDIPADLKFGGSIAIDTETMGLKPRRDRLCVVQLSAGDGTAHLVQFAPGEYDAPNLKRLLENDSSIKIFHFARFDIAVIREYLGVSCQNIYCTRTVSKLVRTYTDKHGLREICRELLDVDLNKQHQSSNWGAKDLSKEQLQYAANDVLYLHKLKDKLDDMLDQSGRHHLAKACCDFLPFRAELDLEGWGSQHIFDH